MKSNLLIPFPKDLLEFSQTETIEWNEQYEESFIAEIPLVYEAAFHNGLDVLKPWKIADQTIPVVIHEWRNIKEELTIKFAKRDHVMIEELMRRGISFFYEVLYWSNHQPVVLFEHKDVKLKIIPINFSERMKFILTRIKNYHSFVQLTELFNEMEKLFWKHQVMKKGV
jgi:hypothetical protein